MDLHSAAATIEQVLALAQRRYDRPGRTATETETNRLANQAALEQVDYLLMEHWDLLDDVAAGRSVPALSGPERTHIWSLSSGMRVAQAPSEALRRVVDLAERELHRSDRQRESDTQATRWLAEFVKRYGSTLDRLPDR